MSRHTLLLNARCCHRPNAWDPGGDGNWYSPLFVSNGQGNPESEMQHKGAHV